MGENGVVRFIPTTGNLDPSAQEFRPTYNPAHHHQYHFLPPQPFYPAQAHHHHPTEIIFHQPPPPQLTSPTYVPQATVPPSLPPPAQSPTRALLFSSVPPDVSESLIRRELEIFGDVRAVQMERVREGIVTVHFYDLRAAHAALNTVRDQHMQHQHRLRIHYSSIFAPSSATLGLGLGLDAAPLVIGPPPPPPPPPSPGLIGGRAVWAQFAIPATNAFPDGHNQGTLVVFHLDPSVSGSTLRQIFQAFGEVKELRETPMKRQQRFVEFYDVRDASRALNEMNGKEINGRSVMIEFSRPGGTYCHKKQLKHHHHHHHQYFNNLNLNNVNVNVNHSPNFHHHHHHPIKPLPPPPPPLPPFRNTRRASPRQRIISASNRRRRSPSSEEESVEAAMSGLRLQTDERENIIATKSSSNASNTTTPTSVSGGSNSGSSSRKGGNGNNNNNNNNNSSSGTSKQGKVRPWKGRHKNFDPRFMIKEDAIMDASACNKDPRTTVMIKNIPNKYSQKLLLNMLDNHCIHCNEQIANAGGDQPLSSYDFVYLPIDFNNKCNVGYGFVNMTSPEATLRLYKAFHHQHWEVFNSRKICEVTYARVQGLEALKEHFKNSKFACENDEYLPVVFTPSRDGRQLTAPLPIVLTSQFPAPSSITVHDHHDHDDVDGGDFTSASTTPSTTITIPSSSDNFHHDVVLNVMREGDDVSISSSNGGEEVMINDDGCSCNSSCSMGRS